MLELKEKCSGSVTAMAELLQSQVKILADWNDTFSVGVPSIDQIEQIRENAKLIMEITVYLVALSHSSNDLSRAIQGTTKKYLENLAERGVTDKWIPETADGKIYPDGSTPKIHSF